MLTKLCLILATGACLVNINCSGGDAHSGDSDQIETAANDDTTSIKKDTKKTDQDDSENDVDLIPVETTTAGTGDISSFILLSSNLETEKMLFKLSNLR